MTIAIAFVTSQVVFVTNAYSGSRFSEVQEPRKKSDLCIHRRLLERDIFVCG
ncbi:hypothetical protein [Anabaena sp. CCY 9402-a]|uniref:hypothetical protein n=1 Tax=Anabaena sp. CCY 9402-a TaxID=3103867 RepID=UPI0039C6CA10